MELTTRNATLDDLVGLLQDQHARKLDMVVPASAVHAEWGHLRVEGADPVIDGDGVTLADGCYLPTEVCDEHIADKLGIPLPYLRRMRAERVDLWDGNVDGWLQGFRVSRHAAAVSADIAADSRSFLLRTFQSDTGVGVARAMLSDRFGIIDNLDVLTAALEGVRDAGVDVVFDGCDLTERRMQVRIVAPAVQALAPRLLAGYRSPNSGWTLDRVREVAAAEGQGFVGGEPIVFAGFVISNSETGGGAFSIVPRCVVQVCKNGLTFTMDALRQVHLGGKLDEGVVRWSNETAQRSLELVASKAKDAVSTFLDVEYVQRKLDEIEARADREVAEPQRTIETIGKRLRFSQERIESVFGHFIRGGQLTAGGVLNAVTAAAQDVADPDAAFELEAAAMSAFELAVAV
jgi:hypothetical protein